MEYAPSDSLALIYVNRNTVHSIPILISDEDGSLHVNHAGKLMVRLDSVKGYRVEKR